MKISKFRNVAFALITMFSIVSCGEIMKDLKYEVAPNPIEMHGNEITVNINGEFIEKGLNSKVLVELTPVLVNPQGQELAFKMESFKGSKAAGNAKIIPSTGMKFNYSSTKPYDPAFENSVLKVRYKAFKGSTMKKEGITESIADGVTVTPFLIQKDDKIMFAKANLVRSTEKTMKAVINYDKAKSNIKDLEFDDKDITNFEDFLAGSASNSKIVWTSLKVFSYASPEGEMDKNSNLAVERAQSANAYLKRMSSNIGFTLKDGLIKTYPKGEDWNGMKELISKSSHEDKDIIVRVAEMNSDPEKREAEIKTLSSTYTFLNKEIFPQLRRSQLILTYVVNERTNEELLQQAYFKPQGLTIEELVFIANNLIVKEDKKLSLYQEIILKAPTEWRGFNNAGAILYEQGKISEAKKMFEKAYKLNQNNVTSNNWGAMLRQDGKFTEAEELFSNGSGEETSYNMALINIRKGKYGVALNDMGANTFNKALAETLKKDYKTALTTIENSADNNTAIGNYLKAIISVRTGDNLGAIAKLKDAIKQDSSLRAKAKKDREFIKLFKLASFAGL